MYTPKNASEALRQARSAEKALTMFQDGYTMQPLFDDTITEVYLVTSPAGNRYNVDMAKQICSCPDFTRHQDCCKHLIAVEYSLLEAENAAYDRYAEGELDAIR